MTTEMPKATYLTTGLQLQKGHAKETESDIVLCSESAAPTNLELIKIDLVAEESQVISSRTEDSNLKSAQREKIAQH